MLEKIQKGWIFMKFWKILKNFLKIWLFGENFDIPRKFGIFVRRISHTHREDAPLFISWFDNGNKIVILDDPPNLFYIHEIGFILVLVCDWSRGCITRAWAFHFFDL